MIKQQLRVDDRIRQKSGGNRHLCEGRCFSPRACSTIPGRFFLLLLMVRLRSISLNIIIKSLRPSVFNLWQIRLGLITPFKYHLFNTCFLNKDILALLRGYVLTPA